MGVTAMPGCIRKFPWLVGIRVSHSGMATAAVAKSPEVKLPGAAEQTQLCQGAALGWILTKQKHQISQKHVWRQNPATETGRFRYQRMGFMNPQTRGFLHWKTEFLY